MLFQRSSESYKAEARLKQGNPGDEIDVPTMESIVEAPCANSNDRVWNIIAKVILRVEKSHGLVWRWDKTRKVWRCLTDREKPTEVEYGIKKIRRRSTRNETVYETVDYSNLNSEERNALASQVMANSVIKIASTQRTIKKLEGKVNQTFLPDESLFIQMCRDRSKPKNGDAQS